MRIENISAKFVFVFNPIIYENHAKSLVTGYCVRRKGTLLDELNRAGGVVQSPLTSQWKATQNETYLNLPPKGSKRYNNKQFQNGEFSEEGIFGP